MNTKQKKNRGGGPLSLKERCTIEIRWCLDHKSITEIANELNRNKSSISRELAGKPRRGHGKYSVGHCPEQVRSFAR